MNILVTGSAGFIGFHLCRRLLAEGHVVAGLDSMVPYYDVTLKRRRHAMLGTTNAFRAYPTDIADMAALRAVMDAERPEVVIHLAAQAGVRYSLDHPEVYVQANVVGTFNLLELVRHAPPEHRVRHLLMASTSSAYGAEERMPFTETMPADTPLTIYAATKRATELVAHSYAHLWDQPITAFRFFTVYGPWGRPDMALFKFTDAALRGTPVDVHGHGRMERDFTYVEDLVEAILRLVPAIPVRGEPVAGDSLSPVAPFRIVNIGNGAPVGLLDFIAEVERATGRSMPRRDVPIGAGEVPRTWADSSLLETLTGYRPSTPVSVGVPRFVEWFRGYYGL